LYKSPVTQEPVNISEKAHIYSFSKGGPRGRGPHAKRPSGLNHISNLLLVCHDCHKKIDKYVERYSAPLLKEWKEEHERRIRIVTGVNPTKKSYVVLYTANIGDDDSPLQPEQANRALFPRWYPAEEDPVVIRMVWKGKDDKRVYWRTEETDLRKEFNLQVKPRIAEKNCHFSIFGLAPMPLLILLGSLFTEKVRAQVYQLQREPEQTWRWSPSATETTYLIRRPSTFSGRPVLIISLSFPVARNRVISVLGPNVSIWELTIRRPNPDFLKTTRQLSEFRKACRKVISLISGKHGLTTTLAIFPVMPVACSVDLGRIRFPKADMPWDVYDHNKKLRAFAKALTIGGR
jgi:hypothetical protein